MLPLMVPRHTGTSTGKLESAASHRAAIAPCDNGSSTELALPPAKRALRRPRPPASLGPTLPADLWPPVLESPASTSDARSLEGIAALLAQLPSDRRMGMILEDEDEVTTATWRPPTSSADVRLLQILGSCDGRTAGSWPPARNCTCQAGLHRAPRPVRRGAAQGCPNSPRSLPLVL